MTLHAQTPRRPRRFYGWYILAASFVILFFNTGARLSFGVMFKPMLAALGWDRGALSAAFFLHMGVYALSLVVVGRLYDRYGPKWVIILSTLCLSAGYMLTALIASLWQLFVCYSILAAIGLGGTSVPLIAALMSKWFVKWRGLAISLALCGGSLGQFVLVPLATEMVLGVGWRTAHLAIGVTMALVNIPLALLVIRGDPEALGQRPLGAQEVPVPNERADVVQPHLPGQDVTLRGAVRTPSLWLFLTAMFVCGGGDFLIATHLIPLVTDHGISPTAAGHLLAWYGLMSLVGLLVAGPASDLIGNKIPIASTFLIRLGLFGLMLQDQNATTFTIFALAFGFTHLITAPLTPTLVIKLYGVSHVGLIGGLITTVHHLSGGLWAYLGGAVFDRTGSYQAVFVLYAGFLVVAFVCSLLLVERRHQETLPTFRAATTNPASPDHRMEENL